MLRLLLCTTWLVAVATALTACGRQQTDSSLGLIQVDGSSTVFPITEAVAEEFQKAEGVRVTVGISGTGGGFEKLCRGETDINDASRPIRPTEMETCERNGVTFIELPVAYDGLAVVVNPKNTWATSMTVEELRTLWTPEAQGNVTRWNQVRPSWPDREIHLFGAGVDSGTYDYFTEAIVGKEGASRGDFTSSEDDNVIVQGVASDELGLGFMGLAYVEQNASRLKPVPIDDGKKENGDGPIAPSIGTVRNGTYQPLSRPLFIYISSKAAERPEVQRFVEAYLTMGRELVVEVGYVELTPQIYELAQKYFADRRLGTAFGSDGSQVGVALEELLTEER
jgi:phosphate transport system substrate-binding protein